MITRNSSSRKPTKNQQAEGSREKVEFSITKTSVTFANCRSLIRLALLSLWLMLFWPSCYGQLQWVFTPIDANEGLSENKVRDIAQLPDGRMVFTTEGVTNVFDGANFSYLHNNDNHSYPLSGYSGFHRVYVDADGDLWAKNYKKLFYANMDKAAFVANMDSLFKGMGISAPLLDLFMDDQKNIWLLTTDDVLYVREAKATGAIVFLQNVSNMGHGFDCFYDLAMVDGILYLFYRSGVVVGIDYRTKKLVYNGTAMSESDAGRFSRTLLVVAHGSYLYQIRNGIEGHLVRLNTKTHQWETLLQTRQWLNTLSVDGNGDIWVSCSDGLYRIGHSLTEKQFIPSLHLVDGRAIHTEISTLRHDDSGGMWVGTLNSGVLYYHPNRFKFANRGKLLFPNVGIEQLQVTCFADNPNGVLVGTNRGLYKLLDGETMVVPYSNSLSNVDCISMASDSKGRIWLCGGSGGLYCIDGPLTTHAKLSARSVNSVLETREGRFYVCTNDGVGMFDPASGHYSPIDVFVNKPVGNVYQLVDDKNGGFFGISDAGVFQYNPVEQHLHVPSASKGERHAMFQHSNHRYNSLLVDGRGYVWFGTQDGLNVWVPKLDRLFAFYTHNGLVNNSVQSIVEDGQQSVWVATANGISKVTVDGQANAPRFSFTNFNRYDGVIENEFLERSVFVRRNGSLYWGGIDGFNELPIHKNGNGEPAMRKPLFTKLQLFGKEVKVDEVYNGRVLLPQSIGATSLLHLKHHENFIALEFSALNYVNPTQTYYRYKLEGVDADWRETSSGNGLGTAVYTKLAPGKYRFVVAAASNQSRQFGQTAVLEIVVASPLWKTPVAYVLYWAIVFLMVWIGVRTYLKRKKQQLAKQQKLDLEEAKLRFFTNVSHELRTPLTLVITPLQALLAGVDDVLLRKPLEGIHRNAQRLLEMVNQLLDFRRLEAGAEKLWPNHCNVPELVREICSSFDGWTIDKEIHLGIDCHQPDFYAQIDSDKFRTIVNNLLSNGFKFTPRGGSVNVVLKSSQTSMELTVSDSGCGISADELPHVFERFFQSSTGEGHKGGSGIGLHLVNEYVRLHQGSVRVESVPGGGSVFTVVLPLSMPSANGVGPSKPTEASSRKILVVEDNDEFRAFLCEQLSSSFDVVSANNGEQGLAMALEHLPDLVVSDIMMPVMDGIELCKQVKSDLRISHTPLVLLTARSSNDSQMDGYQAGADAVISKPFNMDILLMRIGNLLARMDERKALFKKAIVVQPENLTSTGVDEAFVKKVLSVVERHLGNADFSVEQLSYEMNMDRTGLYRKLVAIVGQTPSEFIRMVRLKRAVTLLEQGFLVNEVADKVGFGTPGYFSKCFQEEYGVKPSQYGMK